MAAGAVLKSLYPKLFHVIYILSYFILHDWPMKVKSHFEDIDQLTTKVKSATAMLIIFSSVIKSSYVVSKLCFFTLPCGAGDPL